MDPEIIILILMSAFSLLLVFKNMKLSLYVLILLSVFLHKEIFSIYKWDILPVRVLMVAIFVFGLIKTLLFFRKENVKYKIKNFVLKPFVFLLLMLWITRGISIINTKNFMASIYLLAFFTTITALGLIIFDLLNGKKIEILRYIKLYILVLFASSIVSFIQLFVYSKYGIIFGAFWNIPGHISRVGALFWDVNHFAGLLAAVLPVLGILVIVERKIFYKALYFLMFVPMSAVLILTNSRSGWIEAFVAFVTFLLIFLYRKIKLKGIILVFFLFLMLTTPALFEYSKKSSPFRAKIKQYLNYRLDSFDSHFLLLTGATQVFEKYPYIGGGYGSFFEQFSKAKVASEYFGRDPAALNVRVPAHTIWGESLAETGALGSFVFVLFVGLIFFSLLYAALTLENSYDYLLLSAMASAVFGWMVAGIFYSYNTEFFWLVLFLYYLFAVSVLGDKYSVADIFKYLFSSGRLALILLGFISLVLIFGTLGKNHLIPWDEAIYAKISKNITNTDNYVVLSWIENTAWFEKPPLYMWLTVFFMKAIGINSWAVRLTSAIMGFGTVLITYLIGKKLFNKTVGFLSAFILLTTFHFLYYSRIGMLDVTTTFFLTSAVYLYICAKDSGKFWYWTLSGVFCGLAVMTKGVIGLLVIPVMGINEIFSKRKLANYVVFLVSLAVVSLPWHVIMYKNFGVDFLKNYLGYHVLARAYSNIEDKGRPFFWYLTVMKVSMRIWFIALIPAFLYSFYLILKKNKTQLILMSWFLFILMFFSIAKSKLVWYIIPLYPAAALIVGFFIDRVISYVQRKVNLLNNFFSKGLILYFMIYFVLLYLFINKDLVYTSDLTGQQASLIQKKDEVFGVGKKLYVDRVELPLVLYYTNGSSELVDFSILKDKLNGLKYDQSFIFITKKGRFETTLMSAHSNLVLTASTKDWVLANLPSVYELDSTYLRNLIEEESSIKGVIENLRFRGKIVDNKLFVRLYEIQNLKSQVEKKITVGLASVGR